MTGLLVRRTSEDFYRLWTCGMHLADAVAVAVLAPLSWCHAHAKAGHYVAGVGSHLQLLNRLVLNSAMGAPIRPVIRI